MVNLLLAMAAVSVAVPPADDAFFEAKIRPVFAEVCARCHGPQKASGGLRLDSRAALLKGGENGPVIVPGKPKESPLLKMVRRVEGVSPMPPDRPLAASAVKDLERWIESGAPWPLTTTPIRAARHWAFEPVQDPKPPTIPGVALANPVDAFILAKLRARGITPVGPSDRRTLLRRVTFDLTGLPPTPKEMESFLNDRSPDAYARVVDRLLASRQYGEKWGRLWLDVVRYADTAGETADYPVPEAWRYRNYVIDAFNADRPYDQFLREQLAGDLLAARLPADAPAERYAELITATGYLAIARRFGFNITQDHYLTIEDTIDTLGKSILGLTLACARCHDHKYDPISTRDYYALYGIFESTRYPFSGCEHTKVPRDNVPLVAPAALQRRRDAFQAQIAAAQKALTALEAQLQGRANQAQIALASGEIPNGGKQAFDAGRGAAALRAVKVRKGEMLRLTILPKANQGADTTLLEVQITEQGGKGHTWNLTRDVLPDFYQNGNGFQHDDSQGHRAVWHFWDAAGTPRLLTEFVKDAERVPGLLVWRGAEATPSVLVNTNPRPVRFLTVKQPARSFAAHPGPRGGVTVAWQSPLDGTVAVTGRVEDSDPTGGDGIAWTLTAGPGLGAELAATANALRTLNRARRQLEDFNRSVPQAYAVAEGKPHHARLHKRGDPESLGEEVPRRWLELLGGQAISKDAGSGRLDLAHWITDPKNPLTARVLVNRVWQGHFGKGLVHTPNDFGTRGEPPTHPELLDWLAHRFVASGWSLKKLHRLILLSDTYQRSSTIEDARLKVDPNNLLWWHFERRRLEAEEIRDALLAVSGDLDTTPGEGHPFPETRFWQFTQHTPFNAVYEHQRRSVYLMTQRIKRHPFLALFDGPDPNASTGHRHTTTVPTQALFFLNDPFTHARAESLARRLLALPDDASRLNQACLLLYGRPAQPGEQVATRKFLESYATALPSGSADDRRRTAWSAWVRVLFSTNEFIYLD